MANNLQIFYFTFGSSPSFPFQEGYIIVKATSRDEAVKRFRKDYHDKNDSCVNCSFIYDETEWKENNIGRYYNEPFCILSNED